MSCKLKVGELRKALDARGLSTKGLKAVLVQRLDDALYAAALPEGEAAEGGLAKGRRSAEKQAHRNRSSSPAPTGIARVPNQTMLARLDPRLNGYITVAKRAAVAVLHLMVLLMAAARLYFAVLLAWITYTWFATFQEIPVLALVCWLLLLCSSVPVLWFVDFLASRATGMLEAIINVID